MISQNYFWINILLLSLGTFAIRFSIISVSHRVRLSPRLKEIFTFIPAAILPAMIAPMVFFHHGQVSWLFFKERFWVLILATVVCYFSKSLIATLVVGMGTLYLLTFI